jgi:hypothetical protein
MTDTRQLAIVNDGQLPLSYFFSFEETTPRVAGSQSGDRELFDLQFSFPLTSYSYEIGVGFDGSFIYSCSYEAPGVIQKYSPDGTFIEEFTISGAPGLVDLAFDGRYFWGSTYSGLVCKMDFTTRTLISILPLTFVDLAVAYDFDNNSLWVSGSSPSNVIYELALDGTLLRTLTSEAYAIIGLGYDNISGDEPSLWAYTQEGPTYNRIQQIDMGTGTVLQYYDVTEAVLPGLANNSGGLEVVSGLVPGTVSLLCCVQDFAAYALELCHLNTWTWPVPVGGVVDGENTGNVQIHFDTALLNPGIYTGRYTLTHNDPVAPPLEIPVQLTVTGTWPAQLSLQPASHDFGEVEQLNPSIVEFVITNTGGSVPSPLIIQEGGISLALQSELNFNLQTPGLPVTLNHGETYTFTVTFTPQTTGVKNGSLTITDNLGRVIHTSSLSGTGITEEIGNIVNFQASVQNNNDVVLTWILGPETPADPAWLHYDSGTNYEGIGTGSAVTFEVAVKFPTATLAPYAGLQLSRISYYPRSALTAYTLKVYAGEYNNLVPSTLLLSQSVVPSANAWNEVSLATPLWITGTQALWVGYEVTVPESSDNFFPAGCDAGPAVSRLGDLMCYQGSWVSMNDNYGISYNWNIQAWIGGSPPIFSPPEPLNILMERISPDLELLHGFRPALSGNPAPPSRVVRGFNIYRDGVLQNAELLPTPTYTDEDLPNGIYEYLVQAVYYSASTYSPDPVTVIIEYYPPFTLPFYESWEYGSLEANHWSRWVDNWNLIWSSGYPDPCLAFFWSPQIENYGEPITSHLFDAIGYSSVNLTFDICLNNYDLSAENWLALEVWNGAEWFTIDDWSSFENNGLGFDWASFSYDLTTWAAGQEFRVRFRAYGQNSWSINYWGIDNLALTGAPLSLPAPTVTATYDPVVQAVLLDWESAPGAEWYGIYSGSDPLLTFPMGEWIPASQTWYYVAPVNRAFYQVTAGAGSPPDRKKKAAQ